MEIHVGPIGDVEPEPLGKVDEGKLVAEEVPRSVAIRVVIRPIEGDDSRATVVLGPTADGCSAVEAVAAPKVVRLPRRHRTLDGECRSARVVAHEEWHISKVLAITDQPNEVVARR